MVYYKCPVYIVYRTTYDVRTTYVQHYTLMIILPYLEITLYFIVYTVHSTIYRKVIQYILYYWVQHINHKYFYKFTIYLINCFHLKKLFLWAQNHTLVIYLNM